jgi:5-methylcytosine-specific restriction endonuclease McrA
MRTPIIESRHVPHAVKREVWRRDGGQCAYRAPDGRRCGKRAFLEWHHIQPYASGGSATVANIALRCRRHNQYEAELAFGARRAPAVGASAAAASP